MERQAVRNRRAEMNVPPSQKAKMLIVTAQKDVFSEKSKDFFLRLASASEVETSESGELVNSVRIVTDGAVIFIPLSEIVDTEKEKTRLTAELKKLDGEIARLSAKLSNEGFVSKAPAAVVEAEKEKLKKYTEMKEKTEAALRAL